MAKLRFYGVLTCGVYCHPQFSGEDECFPPMDTIGRSLSYNWERVVMKTIVSRFVKDESGATAIEYGLIAALVGVGIIAALQNLRTDLQNTFGTVSSELQSAAN